jgi:hypothetical protein
MRDDRDTSATHAELEERRPVFLPWWAQPVNRITVEQLDAVAARVRRAAVVLEVAAGLGAEVAV